ncbi:hemocytin-like [Hyperolius riggenbachi]|uniref:hemocytin-like n=1 Tax=Hyperolius riggenbachi TaxID=752182 RepID=UPI0035A35EBD
MPVIVQPEGTCCPISKCEFDKALCTGKPRNCDPGFYPVLPMGGCCANYTCVPKPVCVKDGTEYQPGSPVPAPPGSCEECTCSDMIDSSTQLHQVICQPFVCNFACDVGEIYTFFPEKCCGECVQIACVFTLPNGTVFTIEGENTITLPDDICTAYTCSKGNGQLYPTISHLLCEHNSADECGIGQDYVKDPDLCCGRCVQKQCIFTEKDGRIVFVPAGQSAVSTSDSCVTYNCMMSAGVLTSTQTQESCQYQSQNDCGPGQTYQAPPAGQCCGQCVPTSCVFILPDGTAQIVNEGETVPSRYDKCVTYSCQPSAGTLISTEMQKSCQYQSQDDCEFYHMYEPPSADQCCGKCVRLSACIYPMPNGDVMLLIENDTSTSNDNCTTYTCTSINGLLLTTVLNETCAVKSEEDCQIGFVFKKDPSECCGQCVQNACVYVTADGQVQTMQIGDIKSDASDSCTTYMCTVLQGVFVTTTQSKTCEHHSDQDCKAGETYVNPAVGQCCGYCTRTSCWILDVGGENRTINVGDTFPSPSDSCVSYGCIESNGQIYSVLFNKTCEPVNPEDCETGSVEISSDGCGQVCKAPKACHVLYNTTTLRQGDCQVEESVPYCSGVCMNMPFTTAPTDHPTQNKCLYCYKRTSSMKTVTLTCSNGNLIQYDYEHIDSCGCLEFVNV